MKKIEHEIQTAAIKWFRLQYPNHLVFAVPNGGHRNKATAIFLKKEGVLAGIPDTFIPVARKNFHGLFVEFKAEKNKPTINQLKVMDKLRDEGYMCVVCYSFEKFKEIVNDYLK